jgi:hypothetical protein
MKTYSSPEELRKAVLAAEPPKVGAGDKNTKPRVPDFNFYLCITSMLSDSITREKLGATKFEDMSRPNAPLTYTPYAEATVARFPMHPWKNDGQRNAMEQAVRGKMYELVKGLLSQEGLAREVFHHPNNESTKKAFLDAAQAACDYVNAAMKEQS